MRPWMRWPRRPGKRFSVDISSANGVAWIRDRSGPDLRLFGDFATDREKRAYANAVCQALNEAEIPNE